MGKGKKKKPVEKKPKPVTIVAYDRNPEGGQTPHAYRIMDWLIDEYFGHLSDANITIAKQLGNIREDVDGTTGVGRVKCGNDLDRAYAEYDFVLIIPFSMFENSDADRRTALIHNLLCYCGVTKDKNGEPKVDAEGRTVYHLRKPVKLFPENVSKFGIWQSEAASEAFKRFKDRDRPLLPQDREMGRGFDEPAKGPLKDDPKPEKGKAKATQTETSDTGPFAVSFSDLKLNGAIEQALTGEGLVNLGAILTYERANGDFKGIAGLTVSRRSQLKQAIGDYLVEHPDILKGHPDLAVPEGEEATA